MSSTNEQTNTKIVDRKIEIGVGTAVVIVLALVALFYGLQSNFDSKINETEGRLNTTISEKVDGLNADIDRIEEKIDALQ